MRSVASLLIALLALGSPASRADLHEALLAYRAHEYDKAVVELTPLARLGESSAQYNLGMMRLKGEGGPRDIVEGVGWLMAAEGHGSSEAANALQSLKSLLDEAQLSRAREHAQRFGPARSRNRFFRRSCPTHSTPWTEFQD